jgi:hypothetical protein
MGLVHDDCLRKTEVILERLAKVKVKAPQNRP